MKINHKADCMCSMLGLTCEQVDKMRDVIIELMERSDKISEILELIDTMSTTEEERAMYMYLFGRQWEGKTKEISGGGETKVFRANSLNIDEILGKVMRDIRNSIKRMDEQRGEEEEE